MWAPPKPRSAAGFEKLQRGAPEESPGIAGLVLVSKGDPNQVVLAHVPVVLAATAPTRPFPLTLLSHPGKALVRSDVACNHAGRFDQYVVLGDADDALEVVWTGSFVQCAGSPNEAFRHIRKVSERSHVALRKESPLVGGDRWDINEDGTISLADYPELVWGIEDHDQALHDICFQSLFVHRFFMFALLNFPFMPLFFALARFGCVHLVLALYLLRMAVSFTLQSWLLADLEVWTKEHTAYWSRQPDFLCDDRTGTHPVHLWETSSQVFAKLHEGQALCVPPMYDLPALALQVMLLLPECLDAEVGAAVAGLSWSTYTGRAAERFEVSWTLPILGGIKNLGLPWILTWLVVFHSVAKLLQSCRLFWKEEENLGIWDDLDGCGESRHARIFWRFVRGAGDASGMNLLAHAANDCLLRNEENVGQSDKILRSALCGAVPQLWFQVWLLAVTFDGLGHAQVALLLLAVASSTNTTVRTFLFSAADKMTPEETAHMHSAERYARERCHVFVVLAVVLLLCANAIRLWGTWYCSSHIFILLPAPGCLPPDSV